MSRRRQRTIALTLVAGVACLALLLRGGDDASYRIEAEFTNAVQLVPGASVRVAGRRVGVVDAVGLSDGGAARVVVRIDDPATVPLHEGTRARIRAHGQAGVINRFVEIQPGSRRRRALPDGAVLDRSRTTSPVQLDAVLSSFDPRRRERLRRLFANASEVFAGSGSPRFNAMLRELAPSLGELEAVARDIGDDGEALDDVLRFGRSAAATVASRGAELESAVASTADALGAVAARGDRLGAALEGAPAAVRDARRLLDRSRATLDDLRPALVEAAPVGRPLASALSALTRTLPPSAPVARRVARELEPLGRAVASLAPIAPTLSTGLRSAAAASKDVRPIARGARIYGSDLIIGLFNGLAGVAAGNYDANGHYVRLQFTQPWQSTRSG
ncbi:MAG: MlaD family protein, partial [Solirubrobacteraceae bacterium]